MIDNFFSPLTSQIFGGLLLAGVAYHIIDEVKDARSLNAAVADRNDAIAQRDVARANTVTLASALRRCNESAKTAADVATRVGNVGAAAVRQVREAGVRALDNTIPRIEAAPVDTCEDAEAILRGEAG